MHHSITKLHHWALTRIFRRLIIQGPTHRKNVVEAMRLLAQASSDEFTEDNFETQNHFLRSCFEDAMYLAFSKRGHTSVEEEVE